MLLAALRIVYLPLPSPKHFSRSPNLAPPRAPLYTPAQTHIHDLQGDELVASLDEFKTEARDWLKATCPDTMQGPNTTAQRVWGGGQKEPITDPVAKKWVADMASRGYTAPTWPKEYGGAGLDNEEARALQSVMTELNIVRPLQGMAFSMLGPTLMEYGSHEQKLKFGRDIADGTTRWCQGYSEPGAGSDLASLQTKAEDMGDHYLVNGSKIWTSGADMADWIFCLVRTDPDAPKHQGISFLLFDMTSEGVQARPILLISGRSPFCQCFFDDVKVPKDQLMGDINKGWTIAKRLLQHERTGIGGGGGGGARAPAPSIQQPEFAAKKYLGEVNGRVADEELRERIASYKMDQQSFGLTVRRNGEESRASNAGPSFLSSLFKYYGTEQNKLRYELLLEAMGTRAFGWEGDETLDEDELDITRQWLRSKANSIEGGTSEVQLNIISKRVLELPD